MNDETVPLVAIVIVNWNSYEDTARCLSTLADLEYPAYDVIVVDNGSTDDSGDRLDTEFPWCTVLFNDENRGFAGGVNPGIDHALQNDADYVLLFNNDATIEDGFLEEIAQTASESGADVVGARIENERGEPINDAPCNFPDMFFYSGYRDRLPYVGPSSKPESQRWWETDRVEGAGVLLSRDVLESRKASLGYYLDESLFMYCEEIELSMWCRENDVKTVIAANATVVHEGESGSSRAFQLYYLTRNRALIARRWLQGPIRILFELLFPISRLIVMIRHLRRDEPAEARSVIKGLIDGYRIREGKTFVPEE